MKKTEIKVTEKAITVGTGKNAVTVPFESQAKGIKWFVTKSADKKRDFVAVGFKRYANGELRANIYLHDYNGNLASLKTADGTALNRIAKLTALGDKGYKYTVTNLATLENFACLFGDFDKARVAYDKASKPQAQASKPQAQASKPQAIINANRGTITVKGATSKAQAQAIANKVIKSQAQASKPQAQASKPTASKSQAQASKPQAQASEKTA